MKHLSEWKPLAGEITKKPTSPRLNWFTILGEPYCHGLECYARLPGPDHGLRRAFCPRCTANLKPTIARHMDRALHSVWYITWFRRAWLELMWLYGNAKGPATIYQMPACEAPATFHDEPKEAGAGL